IGLPESSPGWGHDDTKLTPPVHLHSTQRRDRRNERLNPFSSSVARQPRQRNQRAAARCPPPTPNAPSTRDKSAPPRFYPAAPPPSRSCFPDRRQRSARGGRTPRRICVVAPRPFYLPPSRVCR